MTDVMTPQNEVSGRTAGTPWGSTGYLVYKRTYSRRLVDDDVNSPTEEFPQTVDRVIKACREQLQVGFSEAEESELRDIMLGLKGIVAGRFLWQLGTSTVDRLGLFSLQNCAFTTVDHPIKPFTWTMDALMLGSGVGYNIQKEHVYSLPTLKKAVEIRRMDNASADFIVPDTREGWVKLLELTLEAHFRTGKGFTYSTQLIRGKGAPIKSFGGLASGPEELCWGITQINQLLNRRAKKKINPIDALDIMNIIGYIVVAGNVRRSAQIALGDYDDTQYLAAKQWNTGTIPNWRAMSNNSVICGEFAKLPEKFWDGYLGNGEPYGLVNLRLAKEIGRLGETQYPDPLIQGVNPCLSGDTLIATSDGPLPIKDLVDKEVKIYDGQNWVSNSKFRLTKKMTFLYRVFLKYKGTIHLIRATPSHVWYCKNEIKTITDYLEPGRHFIETGVVGEYAEVLGVVKNLVEHEDVYCTTVESTGKFMLASGIMTGNCSEQTLANKETCALAEIYLPNIKSEYELKKVAYYLYRIVKHSLALPCHQKETEVIVQKQMRMGIGVTGYMQASAEQKSWLSSTYEFLRLFDKGYSKLKGWPTSVKLTTVKPSGTLSLLAGVTPGCHPGFAQYFLRRIRIASNSPLVDVVRRHGFPIEPQVNFDGSLDNNTLVASFPSMFPIGTKLAKNTTAIDQLEVVKELQKNWSDNAVSCTIYYKKEELPKVRDWLSRYYDSNIKACSFLLHSDHGFKQAPYEEISEEEYQEMVSKTRPITGLSSDSTGLIDEDCASGACPVR